MDGIDRSRGWKSFKQRIGLRGMGCCGATWSPTNSTMTIMDMPERYYDDPNAISRSNSLRAGRVPRGNTVTPPAGPTGMNLAMALAAERNSRAESVGPDGGVEEAKTLMRLIEETDGVDWSKGRRDNDKGGVEGVEGVCCVCMERNKGAAFIPCGHTYCRVCSRELWANRGSCPLCNRLILEILDLF